MSTLAVVINPIAGGGRGKKIWQMLQPALDAQFDKVTYRISNGINELRAITQGLLSQKPDFLLIIGGDGTLSHAINEVIIEDRIQCPNTKIAFFNAGSGGDFVRQFPHQTITEFLDRLRQNQSVNSNIGKVTFPNQPPHYFINIASCGLSGHVALTAEKSTWLKKLGGTVNYLIHSLTGLFTYRKSDVRIQIDDASPFECSLLLMAVCNGQYFGGRMHVAPSAKLDDGLLDVVLFRDFTKLDACLKLPEIYFGSHIRDKNVHYVQGKKVSIESIDNRSVDVEADGERIGHLPATFELLEDTLSIIV